MIDARSDFDINSLKPQMKQSSIRDLQIDAGTVAMAKCDGEFSLVRYERNGESFITNRYGHVRKDFPALNEAVEALDKTELNSAEILCELYAVDDDHRPLILPNLIRFSKGREKRLDNLHIGVWDLAKVDGKRVSMGFDWKLQEMDSWFKGCKRVYVLPWSNVQSKAELEDFWVKWVDKFGFEGLVVRTHSDIFKVKPVLDVDAVIIAINKVDSTGKPVRRYPERAVSSVRVALMDEEGLFVELGDCTVADREVQSALWQLHDLKVSEDDKRVYVKPVVIIQIQFTSLFQGSICRKWRVDAGYHFAGEMKFCKMRNPRFVRFRKDKQVNPEDLRLSQIEVS